MTVPAFWSGVRFIAETIASFRRAVHQELPNSRIVSTNHPVNTLLRRRISDVSSPYKTIETWVHHAAVWGNGYLWIKRDGAGQPVALINLNPEITTPFLHEGRKYFFVNLAQPVVIDDADVLHIAMIGFDGIKGYPLVQLMRFALETNKQAEMFTNDYLRRGTFMRGTLEFPQALTPEQMATIRDSVKDFKSADGQKRFELMVLQAGGKLNNSTIPNETSQLIETRKFSDIVVCQLLRISPHVIYQLDSQKLANVQQLGAEVRTYSLSPWCTKIEDEINAKLFTNDEQDAGFYVRLHTDSLLRGDEGTLSTQLLAEVNGGIRTVNEARTVLELEPVGPEGDQLRVPVNFPTAGSQTPVTKGPDAPLDDEQASTPALPAAPAESPEQEQADAEAQEGLPGATVRDPEQQPGSYSVDVPTPRALAVLTPLITAAIERVEIKTEKAFGNRQNKPADELKRWSNVFAGEQSGFIYEVFGPIQTAATSLGSSIDVETLASRYENAVKRRAIDGQITTLSSIFEGIRDGN